MLKKNQVVVITGASSGLGRALALAFAKQGARLAICARRENLLNEVKLEVEALGAEVLAVQANVSIMRDVERFASLIEQTYKTVDVLINNASILGPSPIPLLVDYPAEALEKVLLNNVLVPFLVTQRLLPGMLIRNQGRIINVTSEAGKVGYAGWGAYGISKFAGEGLTYTWADEISETGVTINMVDPGEMDTSMHALAVPDCDYALKSPESCVPVFLFLASDEAAGLNGERVEVDTFQRSVQGHVDE